MYRGIRKVRESGVQSPRTAPWFASREGEERAVLERRELMRPSSSGLPATAPVTATVLSSPSPDTTVAGPACPALLRLAG